VGAIASLSIFAIYTAVPETLGDAALMFTNKNNLEAIAALTFLLVQQPDLSNRVIQAQRKRRVQFLPDVMRPLLSQLLEGILQQTADWLRLTRKTQ
jgi:hypothetical protein